MKIIAFASVLLSFFAVESTFSLPLSEDDYSTAFRHFIKHHGKKYHHTEIAEKYNKFRNNLDFIHNHNQLYHSDEIPSHRRPTYKLAVNEFADMTHEEFKLHIGLRRGTLQQRHLPYLKSLNTPRDLYSVQPAKGIDWVKKGAVTSVKDQGRCGSCYAFSAVGAIEGAHYLATGELVDLSEQEIVDCTQKQGNQGCNGGLMDQVFEFVISNGGICTYSNYTYTAEQGDTCLAKKCDPEAKITGYKDIEAGNEKQLLLALNRQPISVAIEADQPAFQFYSEGVMNGECGAELDHGVLLVGYGTEIVNGTSIDFWKIKNSWSEKWGENGYIRIERGANKCGISDAASYPIIDKNPTPVILLESI